MTSTMNAVIAVMKKGSQAGADNIAQFKAMRSSTSLQTRAMSELRAEWNADNASLTMFGRAMQSVGAIGSTLLSITNTLLLANITLGVSATKVANAQQQLTIATQTYYAAVQEFGPTDARTLRAKQDMIAAENNLKIATAQNTLTQQEQTLAYLGVGLSLGTIIAQSIQAAGALQALGITMGALGGAAAIGGVVIGLALLAYGVITTIPKIRQLEQEGMSATQAFKTLYQQQVQTGDYLGAFVTLFTAGLYTIGAGIAFLVSKATDLFKQLWTALSSGAKSGWAMTVGAVKAGLNDLISVLNAGISGINVLIGGFNSTLGKVTGFTIPNLPTIPMLAQGGIVTSPTLAVLGESGPEMVTPLSPGMRGAGGGTVINNYNYIQGSLLTEQQLGEYIDQTLQRRYGLRRRSS